MCRPGLLWLTKGNPTQDSMSKMEFISSYTWEVQFYSWLWAHLDRSTSMVSSELSLLSLLSSVLVSFFQISVKEGHQQLWLIIL